jgi:hypothetical protein
MTGQELNPSRFSSRKKLDCGSSERPPFRSDGPYAGVA